MVAPCSLALCSRNAMTALTPITVVVRLNPTVAWTTSPNPTDGASNKGFIIFDLGKKSSQYCRMSIRSCFIYFDHSFILGFIID